MMFSCQKIVSKANDIRALLKRKHRTVPVTVRLPIALEEDREREVSLLYIGMTRAKEYLCLSYSGESEFTRYFEQVRTNRLQKKKEEQANGS